MKDNRLREDFIRQWRQYFGQEQEIDICDCLDKIKEEQAYDLMVTSQQGAGQAKEKNGIRKAVFIKDRQDSYEEGVDCCLSKPIKLSFLFDEVERLLKDDIKERFYVMDQYRFYPDEKKFTDVNGDLLLDVTDKESLILEYLCCAPYYRARRLDLMRDVWNYKEGINTTTLESHMHRLRMKFRQLNWKVLGYEEGVYYLAVENIGFPSFSRYNSKQEKDA